MDYSRHGCYCLGGKGKCVSDSKSNDEGGAIRMKVCVLNGNIFVWKERA